MKRLLSLFILLAGFWIGARCQTTTLKGLVVDKESGEPLQGATVEISGNKKLHVISGLNGGFLLRGMPVGDYKITAFFVGYGKYEGDLSLNRQNEAALRIGLERKKQELTAVNVSGSRGRGSELSTVLADRRADIVQNSLGARSIEISPDLSVANTAQRISGVSLERSANGEGQYVIIRGMDKRYIYTLVNGVKIPSPDNKNRYVPLDLFPADMLERLEVFKSLTPNMEGDAIGGAVNMVMKDAPSKFSVNANAALGYADKFFHEDYGKFDNGPSLNRSPRVLNGPGTSATMKDFPNSAFSHSSSHNPVGLVAGLSLGGRLFKDKLGIMVAGSYQNNYRNIHSIFFGSQTSAVDGSAQLSSVENRQYSSQQERSGVHARLDYRLDDKNKISLYGAFLNLVRQDYRNSSDTNLILNRVGPGFGRISNSYRDFHEVQQIADFTLKGEHDLSKDFTLDWMGSYSKATLNRPDDATLNINAGVQKDPVTGNKVADPTNIQESSREFIHSTDEDKSGYLNLKYHSKIGGAAVDWMAGGMYRDKHRTSSYDKYRINPDPGGQIYTGDINQATFTVSNGEGTSNDPLNYNAEEKVGAAYGMVKIDWGRWIITGGARYEHTDLSWYSFIPADAYGKTGSITYYDVLPSGNIKYSLGKKQSLRLSYYSAITRPNFYEILPQIGAFVDNDFRDKGNPSLKRTTADNLDLRYEYFPKGLDQFQAGIFYKRLKNPIEYSLTNAGDPNDPQTSTELYYIPKNYGTATNYGAEFDMTKYWRWFGIKANYTYTNSSITSPKTQNFSIPGGTSSRQVDQKRSLQGQSKHIANLSLLFKDDNHLGLNAQLAFGYTSRRINTVSQYLNNDIWQKDFEQMDFSVEKRLARHWYIYAKVNNILNTPYELELLQPYVGGSGVNSAPYQQQGKKTFVRKDTYGANYLLGVKFKM